jgi:hypothetical protein
MTTTVAPPTNEQLFTSLMASLEKDPAARAAFQADPLPVLIGAGIPLAHTPPVPQRPQAAGRFQAQAAVTPAAAGGASGEQISAETHWWGVDIITNEKLTEDIINGTVTAGALGGSIAAAFGVAGILTGGLATAIGAGLAVAFALKVYEMQLINAGNGVHWPISWVQWAGLLAGAAGGPVGITAAAMLWIHPGRN